MLNINNLLIECKNFQKIAAGILIYDNLSEISKLFGSIRGALSTIEDLRYGSRLAKKIDLSEGSFIAKIIFENCIKIIKDLQNIFLLLDGFVNTRQAYLNIQTTFKYINFYDYFNEYNLTSQEMMSKLDTIKKLAANAKNLISIKTVRDLYEENPAPEKSLNNFKTTIIHLMHYLSQMINIIGNELNTIEVISALSNDINNISVQYYNESEMLDDIMDPVDRNDPGMISRVHQGDYF